MHYSKLARRFGLNRLLRNNEDGFTLIELLIVVIIIGILAAIALPIFLNQQKAAADARVQSDVRNNVDEVTTYLTKNPSATNIGTTADNTPPVGTYHLVSSGDDVINVIRSQVSNAPNSAEWDGYAITGYSPSGVQYNASKVYMFDSLTGKFGAAPVTYGGIQASNTQMSAVRSPNGPFVVTLSSNLPAGAGTVTTSGANQVTVKYQFTDTSTGTTAAATGASALQVRGDYSFLDYDINDCKAEDNRNTLAPGGPIDANNMRFYARDGSQLNVVSTSQWYAQGNISCVFSQGGVSKGQWSISGTFTSNNVTYNGSSDLSTLQPAYVTFYAGNTWFYMKF